MEWGPLGWDLDNFQSSSAAALLIHLLISPPHTPSWKAKPWYPKMGPTAGWGPVQRRTDIKHK